VIVLASPTSPGRSALGGHGADSFELRRRSTTCLTAKCQMTVFRRKLGHEQRTLTTLAHLSDSVAMSFTEAAGEPRKARRRPIRQSRKPAKSAVRRDEDVDARIRVHDLGPGEMVENMCAGNAALAEFTQAVQKNQISRRTSAVCLSRNATEFPQHRLHVLHVSVCAGPPSAGVRQPVTSKRARFVCDDEAE
jgi:hypothetical protein